MAGILGGEKPNTFMQHFHPALDLLAKIERWWIRNVEMATDPDWDGKDVEDVDITPGRILLMQIIVDVAQGDAETATGYLKALREKWGKEGRGS